MSDRLVERRNLTQEFRISDADAAPKIEGYASLFNSQYDAGYWLESVDAHAFDSALASNPDCRALFNHDANCVLGRTTANTLTLSLDSRGLAYSIDPPDTTLARDLMVSMRRKDITQSSFGFIVKRDQWTDNPDGTISRLILEIAELLDVSPVTYPANGATSSTVRSLPLTMPTEIRSRLQPAMEQRDAVDDDDEVDAVNNDECFCGCAQCKAGSCGICSSDPQCIGAVRQVRTRLALYKANRKITA